MEKVITFADRTARILVKVRVLLYAVDMIVQNSDIDGVDADRVANLISVIEDELNEAAQCTEKSDFIERTEEQRNEE